MVERLQCRPRASAGLGLLASEMVLHLVSGLVAAPEMVRDQAPS